MNRFQTYTITVEAQYWSGYERNQPGRIAPKHVDTYTFAGDWLKVEQFLETIGAPCKTWEHDGGEDCAVVTESTYVGEMPMERYGDLGYPNIGFGEDWSTRFVRCYVQYRHYTPQWEATLGKYPEKMSQRGPWSVDEDRYQPTLFARLSA